VITKPHKKHSILEKPIGGKFHKNEIAFLGAPCGVIQKLCHSIINLLNEKYQVGYVDADHGQGTERLKYSKKYTDKISHHQLEFHKSDPSHTFRKLFNDEDLVLVNGNHFLAEKQLVIINPKKEESLRKKLDRLTDVRAIILDEGASEVYPFIKDSLPDFKEIQVLKITDIRGIARVIETQVKERKSRINGLVFAGGKSIRMGRDKGEINYYGKPQKEYVADLLKKDCDDVYISTQCGIPEKTNYHYLKDTFLDLGPYGGLLSAFRHNPNSSWLAVACDIPLLNTTTIKKLVDHRDESKVATCYHNPATDFPEPLITLWEPRAYPVLLEFLSRGYSCPRKVLINSSVKELEIEQQEILMNVNTPEELKKVQQIINA